MLTSIGLRAILPALALWLAMPAYTSAQKRPAGTPGGRSWEEVSEEGGRRIDSLKMAFSMIAERTIVEAHPEEVAEIRRKWGAILPEAEEKGIGRSRRLPLARTADSLVLAARSLVRRHPELKARYDEVVPAAIAGVVDWEIAELRAGKRSRSRRSGDDRDEQMITQLQVVIGNPQQFRLLVRMARQMLFPAIVLDSTARENGSTENLIRSVDELRRDDPRPNSLDTLLQRGLVRIQEEYWGTRVSRYAERINAALSPADRALLDTLRFRMAPLIDIGEDEGEATPIIMAARKIAARKRKKLNPLRDSVLRDITTFNAWYPEQVAGMLLQLHDTADEEAIDLASHEMVAQIDHQGKWANLRQPGKHYTENIEPAILLLPSDKLLRSGVLSPLTRIINSIEGRE